MTRPVGIEIFYWLDNWSDDQSSVFSKAAEAGYEGVEISLVAGLDVGVDRMARTAASLGLDDLDGYRQRSAAALHEVAGYASTLGIDICLEVLNRFEIFMFNTVAECLEFIDTVVHPSVKVELDTFHMNMEEDDLAAAVRSATGRIRHVQVAANNRRAPQYGHIDWASFSEALDDSGYDGWVVFETFPNSKVETGQATYAWRDLTDDPDRDAAGAAAFIRENIA